MKRILPKIYLQRGTNNWIYFAIGRWQPFAFFGASGWIAPSVKWLAVRFFSEVRRHCRMTYARFALPLILCLLFAPLAGCPSQNTTAALVGIAGTAIATLETIEGNTDAAAQIQQDFNLAQTAVLNWKAGTPTQDVAQALALVQNDLGLLDQVLPDGAKDKAYIELAIGTVQSILDLFPSTATPQFAVTAKVARVNIVAPKTAAEFKAKWNALPGKLAPIK